VLKSKQAVKTHCSIQFLRNTIQKANLVQGNTRPKA